MFFFSRYRIKTNGSLPRNEGKRSLQSPNGAAQVGRHLNSSEDELTGIFTFETPTGSVAGKTSASPSPERQVINQEPAPNNCKSPYENVCAPHSPRTRIRTQLVRNTRDEPDTSPVAAVVAAGLPAEHTYQLITSGVAAEVSHRAGFLYN